MPGAVRRGRDMGVGTQLGPELALPAPRSHPGFSLHPASAASTRGACGRQARPDASRRVLLSGNTFLSKEAASHGLSLFHLDHAPREGRVWGCIAW